MAKHNCLRDWYCATYNACTGLPSLSEQYVPQRNVVDPKSGQQFGQNEFITIDDIHVGFLLFQVIQGCKTPCLWPQSAAKFREKFDRLAQSFLLRKNLFEHQRCDATF